MNSDRPIVSTHTRREAYIGPWLPEPWIEEIAPDPVERAEDVSVAFLLALQRLSSIERAAFLAAVRAGDSAGMAAGWPSIACSSRTAAACAARPCARWLGATT